MPLYKYEIHLTIEQVDHGELLLELTKLIPMSLDLGTLVREKITGGETRPLYVKQIEADPKAGNVPNKVRIEIVG